MAAAYPAQCLLANAKVRSNVAKRYSFQQMWCLLHQFLIAFGGCFKLGIYKPIFQPQVVFFIRNPHQSFYFMVISH